MKRVLYGAGALSAAGLLFAGTILLLDDRLAYHSPLAMADPPLTPRQEVLLGLRELDDGDVGRGSEEALDALPAEVAALVARGREVVHGDGLCFNCHRIGDEGNGTQGPDLAGIGSWAGRRVPGLSAAEYLVQSLLDPEAYVVSGYAPTMIPVRETPIELSDDEVLWVVAYLESLGGSPTVGPGTDLAEITPAPPAGEKQAVDLGW